jgi:hypothetical protein
MYCYYTTVIFPNLILYECLHDYLCSATVAESKIRNQNNINVPTGIYKILGVRIVNINIDLEIPNLVI